MLNIEVKKKILTTAISTSILMSLLFNNSKEIVYASENPYNNETINSELINNNEITEIEKNAYDEYMNNFTSIHKEMWENRPEERIANVAALYGLTEEEFKVVLAIVITESDKTYIDSYAVANCIDNRVNNIRWVNSCGNNLYKQATASKQFVVYGSGAYKNNLNNYEGMAYEGAMNYFESRIPIHNYLSFKSNGSNVPGSELFSPTGNRFHEIFPEHERIIPVEELEDENKLSLKR